MSAVQRDASSFKFSFEEVKKRRKSDETCVPFCPSHSMCSRIYYRSSSILDMEYSPCSVYTGKTERERERDENLDIFFHFYKSDATCIACLVEYFNLLLTRVLLSRPLHLSVLPGHSSQRRKCVCGKARAHAGAHIVCMCMENSNASLQTWQPIFGWLNIIGRREVEKDDAFRILYMRKDVPRHGKEGQQRIRTSGQTV